MRKTLFFCFLTLLLLLLSLPVGAAQFEAVEDRAGLLADAEAFRTADADDTACPIRFFLLTDTAAEALSGSEVCRRCGISAGEDAAVLLVRMTGGRYYYDMYTYGEADRLLSNRDVDQILDDSAVYDDLKAGRVEEGAARWRALCTEKTRAYYEKTAKKEATRVPRGILAVSITFLVSGGIAVLSVALYYRRKLHGEIYPLDRYAKLQLQVSNDLFVGSYITRVRVRSNSSGGGGSRGGGGGGHRGGR